GLVDRFGLGGPGIAHGRSSRSVQLHTANDRVRANVTREVSAAVAPPSLVIRTPCHVAAGSTVPRTTPGHCRDASAPAPSTARDAYPGPRGTIQQHDSRGHAGPAD